MVSFISQIFFVMLSPIFVKKDFKVPAIFTRLKSKALLSFKHAVDLLFLPILTIEPIALQVYDKSVLFFFNKS